MNRARASWIACFLTLIIVWMLGACSADGEQTGWVVTPGMMRSIPFDPFDPSPLPSENRVGALRASPPNTIPLHLVPFPYAATEQDAERAGREFFNPFPANVENVRRGETVFFRFCSPCHGAGGRGDGKAFPTRAVPSLFDRAAQIGDGHIFHIITYGQDVMPPYAHAISVDDRWKVILYLRSLQRAVSSLEQIP